MADQNLRDILLNLETSLVEQPTRSSRTHLEALLAPEFFEFTTSGRRIARAEIIEALISEPPSSPLTWRIDSFEARALTPVLALATFHTSRHDPSTHRTTRSLRSSLWRCDGDAWRLVFHQGTPSSAQITVKEAVEALAALEPGVVAEAMNEDDMLSLPTVLFGRVGGAFARAAEQMSSHRLASFLREIERLLREGDDCLQTAVTTGFWEAVISRCDVGNLTFATINEFVGPESRAYCIAWDKFNSSQTLGLTERSP